MTTAYRTEQETFWAGEFGDDYASRNQGGHWIAANAAMFAKVLQRACGIQSVLELGANIGLNLQALKYLLPEAELSAVEINKFAVEKLRREFGSDAITESSILDFTPSRTYDLVFTKGVLIHIDPDSLGDVYDCMYASVQKYVLVAEYYSPRPVELTYRGHDGRLFKRDFAGELLDRFENLRLVDYGFAYHRDAHFPQDDLNWFLLEKS